MELCNEIKIMEKMIEMYMFMMVVQDKMDMKGVGLQIVLDLIYKRDNWDLIIGFQMRIQVGWLNWEKVLIIIYVIDYK